MAHPAARPGGTYGTPPGGTPGAPSGPPSYPPPPGPPPGGYSAGPPPGGGTDRTTLWGVLGIVIGLICCGILGIVFGALSIRDAKRYGKSPVLGWVAIVLGVISIIGSVDLQRSTGTYPGIELTATQHDGRPPNRDRPSLPSCLLARCRT